MNEHLDETQALVWETSHPWLAQMADLSEEDDSVGEVVRYSLDEMRIE